MSLLLGILALIISILGTITGTILLIVQAITRTDLKGVIILPSSIAIFICSIIIIGSTSPGGESADSIMLESKSNEIHTAQLEMKETNENFLQGLTSYHAFNAAQGAKALEDKGEETTDSEQSKEKQASTNGEKTTVTRVVDGDTVEVNYNGMIEDVRLLLVDTPETVHPSKPVQPFGPEASQFAKDSLSGQQVTLEFDGPKRDKYDRLLAYIWVNGENFNQLLLEKGLARYAYIYDPPYTHQEAMKAAEKNAKAKGIGIWSREGYVTSEGCQSTQTQSQPEKERKSESAEENASSGLQYQVKSNYIC